MRRSADLNDRIADLHILAAPDFRGFPQLLAAIDADRAAGHDLLADAAAAAQPDQFQQLVELDIVPFKSEMEFGL